MRFRAAAPALLLQRSLGNSVGALPSPYLQLCSGQPSDPPLASCPRELPPAEVFVHTDLPSCCLLSPGQTGAELQGTAHGHAHLLSSTTGDSAEPWPATQRKGQRSPAAATFTSAAVQLPFRSATNRAPSPTTCRLQGLAADALEAARGHTHTQRSPVLPSAPAPQRCTAQPDTAPRPLHLVLRSQTHRDIQFLSRKEKPPPVPHRHHTNAAF